MLSSIFCNNNSPGHRISQNIQDNRKILVGHHDAPALANFAERTGAEILPARAADTDWLTSAEECLSAGPALLLSWLSLAGHQLFKDNNEMIHMLRRLILLFEFQPFKLDPYA